MSASHIDETLDFSPKFNADGLISAIVQDHATKEILMFAWMNHEALTKTKETKLAYFYSRSRNKLWLKGETSGETFRVHKILTDCDQDCLLLMVEAQGKGNACHTGRRSCFYRELDGDKLSFSVT